MVRVRYALKIELKYRTLVRYGLMCEVRSTQILNVPYRIAILDYRNMDDSFVVRIHQRR